MTDINGEEKALIEKINRGHLIESEEEMTPGYKKALTVILTVQGDTELMSAPSYYLAAKDAPNINSRIAVSAIIQDELGHANIAYRLLEDIGVNKRDLIYNRAPNKFKNPYGFDQALENWPEMVVANGFFDRAGITLLSDIHDHTSYGPWKRALVKVGKEELLHLRHGETWMKRLSKAGGAAKEGLQRAIDWMFPMTLEWFGLPDDRKKHNDQLTYKLKGYTNDELRQIWMRKVVPLCEAIGIKVPAHLNEDTDNYEIEYEFPIQYNPDEKLWLFNEHITWEKVFDRWRGRGPMNERYVEMIQGNSDSPLSGSKWLS